jgi:hypothetical protein
VFFLAEFLSMFSIQSDLSACVVQKFKAKSKCHNYFNRPYLWSTSKFQRKVSMYVLFVRFSFSLINRAHMLRSLGVLFFEVNHNYTIWSSICQSSICQSYIYMCNPYWYETKRAKKSWPHNNTKPPMYSVNEGDHIYVIMTRAYSYFS